FGLVELVVASRLVEDAVEREVANRLGRDFMNVRRPRERARPAAVAFRPAGLHGEIELGTGVREVVEIRAVDVPAKNAGSRGHDNATSSGPRRVGAAGAAVSSRRSASPATVTGSMSRHSLS